MAFMAWSLLTDIEQGTQMTKFLAGPVLKAREEKKPRFAIAVFHNLLEKRTNSFALYILAGKK